MYFHLKPTTFAKVPFALHCNSSLSIEGGKRFLDNSTGDRERDEIGINS